MPAQPTAPTTHLLYLHGFRSSPQSMKAQKMAAWVAAHCPGVVFGCPQLPPSPQLAMALVAELVQAWQRAGPLQLAVMGSSLGGFYATWVAERLPAAAHAPVVLINPAVDPARDLAQYIGELTAFHDPTERFFFRPEFVDELKAQRVGELTQPARYQVWAATGDEVLDWRDMQARYQACGLAPLASGGSGGVHVVPGSDHALSDFDDHLPAVLRHLRLTP